MKPVESQSFGVSLDKNVQSWAKVLGRRVGVAEGGAAL